MKQTLSLLPGLLLFIGAIFFACNSIANEKTLYKFAPSAVDLPVAAMPEKAGGDHPSAISSELPLADGTYTLEHPNSKDSLIVVSIVHGVLSTITVANPKLGIILNKLLDIGTLITAGILWIWRWASVRRLRRRNPGVNIKFYD